MKGKDQIEQLFSDKLGNFEAKVDPSLWSGVSAQLGAQAAATTTAGISLLTKAIIGISAASIIIVSAIVLTNDNVEPIKEVVAVTEGVLEPTKTISNTSVLDEVNPIIPQTTNSAISAVVEETLSQEIVSEDAGLLTDLVILNENTELLTNEKSEVVVENEVIEETEELEIIQITDEEVVVEAEEIELYTIDNLPNIFTPNGDGSNDIFSVNSKGLSDFSITILNTQNQVVFKSNDAKFKWSGLDFSQNQVATGNYVYYITARDSAGNPVNKYSQLVIRR